MAKNREVENYIGKTFSRKHFNKHFWAINTPIKISGGAKDWDACKKWTPDYLESRLVASMVWVAHNKQGIFDYNKNSETGIVAKEEVPFYKASQLVRKLNYYYVQQKPLIGEFEILKKDVPSLEWIGKLQSINQCNLWYGGAGCFSPLHYDRLDNFLVQVSGEKHITLFAPSDGQALYPNIGQDLPHISRINLLDIDYEKFPMAKNVQAYTVVLEPGDVLYIPRYWWHAVRSLNVSISLNFWLDIRFRYLVTPVARMIHKMSFLMRNV